MIQVFTSTPNNSLVSNRHRKQRQGTREVSDVGVKMDDRDISEPRDLNADEKVNEDET